MRKASQGGNVYTILLAGIMLSGTLSVALYQLMSGPALSTVALARKSSAEAQIQTAARMMIGDALTQTSPDCDGDGSIEPRAWRAAGSGIPHPLDDATPGGPVPGLIPLSSGVTVTDPWGTDYGYCVWDVGSYNDPAVVHGSCAANVRLKGNPTPAAGNAKTQDVIAILSAGPDRTFQTTCKNYVDATTDLVSTTAGSDDVVMRYPYNQAAHATPSLWSLRQDDPSTAIIPKDMDVTGATGVSAGATTLIGKAQALGATKLGDESTVISTCTADMAGLLRYYAAGDPPGTPVLQYCLGGASPAWTTISSGGGGSTGTGGGTIAALDPDGLSDYVTNYLLGLGKYTLDTDADGTVNAGPPTYGFAIGTNAGKALTTGQKNLAIGYNALTSATTAGENTAFGKGALGTMATTFQIGTSISVVNTPAKYSLAAASAATTHTTAYTTTGSGNTLIALVAAKRAASTTMTLSSVKDDQGSPGTYNNTWTLAGTASSDCANPQGAAAIYYKSNVTSGTFNVRVTANQASEYTWTILEVSGLTNSSPVDQTGSTVPGANATSITVTAGGNLAQANELVVGALMNCYTAGSTTLTVNQSGSTPTSWTQSVSETAGNTNLVASFVHHISTGITAPAHVWGFGNTTRAVAKLATFKGSSTSVSTYAGGNTAIGASALAVNTGIFNAALGSGALAANTTGSYNTALGYQALLNSAVATTSALNLTAIGYQALKTQNYLVGNLGIGYQALSANNGATSGNNVGIGYKALAADATNSDQVAIGYQAMMAANGTSTTRTVAIGANALAASTTNGAYRNFVFGANAGAAANDYAITAFGANALAATTTIGNGGATAFGANALAANIGQYDLTAFGANALAAFNKAGTASAANTAFGASALAAETTGTNNTAFGYAANAAGNPSHSTAIGAYALQNNTAADNTAAGFQALQANTSGTGNTAVGWKALSANTTASQNTAYGAAALQNNTTGAGVTAFGAYALQANTQGSYNTAAGYEALKNNSGVGADYGERNTAVGYQALYSNTSGDDDTAVGYQALYSNTTGLKNTAVGYQALYSNTTASENTAMGYQALYANTTGAANSAQGYRALYANTTGSYNLAFGAYALQNNTTGSYNTAYGGNALKANTTASGATAYGYNALLLSNPSATISGNTAFGYEAMAGATAESGGTAIGYRALYASSATAPVIGVVQGTPSVLCNFGGCGNNPTTTSSFAALPTSGNTIIVVATGAHNGTSAFSLAASQISDNQGGTSGSYTLAASHVTSATGTYVFYRSAITAPSGTFTVTVSPTAANGDWTYGFQWKALEVIGLASTSPVDQTITGSSATGSLSLTTGAVSQNNEFAIAVAEHSCSTDSVPVTNSAGWDTAFSQSWISQYDGQTALYKTLTAGGTVSNTFTWACASGGGYRYGFDGLIVTFKGDTTSAAAMNTAMGKDALAANTTGVGNTALGSGALPVNTTGSYNTAAGFSAGPAATYTALNNTGAFGYNAQVTASDAIRLGDTNITNVYGQVAFSATSDRRMKQDIQDTDLGEGFIMSLRPVSYRLIKGNGRRDYGFIAQEVEAALAARITNMVTREDDPMGTYRLRASDIIAPLVATIQQQEKTEERQRAEIDGLRARVDKLKAARRARGEEQ